MTDEPLDDLLDRLVAEYSDRVAAGQLPDRAAVLAAAPAEARPGLERCLKRIDAGLARAPRIAGVLAPGVKLDQYTLVRELGRGGMALVWLAHDEALRRPVALKILRPGLALEQRHADRFQREGTAVAKLSHPHVVQIHGVGESQGLHYLAMEFVEGPTLSTVLEALPAGRRSAEDLARASGIPSLAEPGASFEAALAKLLAPVADALATAHEAGLVHRDVKPSNILIHRDGRAVVADFGLAKGSDDPALSLTGDALGTPWYMSPEQAYVTGFSVDHRTDVYSLGVTIYEALSGRRPYGGESLLEVIEAIRSQIPPPLRSLSDTTSKDTTALVRRAMARAPEDRYGTMASFAEDLRALANGLPTAARKAEGGPLGRLFAGTRALATGVSYEYRSERSFLGLPLVHVYSGRRFPGQRLRIAKGWFAAGDVAVGGVAFGSFALGGLTCGGVSLGMLVGFGGIATGLLSFGGFSLGGFALGGFALGVLAFGGIALGYAAIGGIARGTYAAGGNAVGTHVLSDEVQDPAAVEFFDRLAPWFLELMGAG